MTLHMYMLFFMLQRLNELCDTKSAELEVINIIVVVVCTYVVRYFTSVFFTYD